MTTISTQNRFTGANEDIEYDENGDAFRVIGASYIPGGMITGSERYSAEEAHAAEERFTKRVARLRSATRHLERDAITGICENYLSDCGRLSPALRKAEQLRHGSTDAWVSRLMREPVRLDLFDNT